MEVTRSSGLHIGAKIKKKSCREFNAGDVIVASQCTELWVRLTVGGCFTKSGIAPLLDDDVGFRFRRVSISLSFDSTCTVFDNDNLFEQFPRRKCKAIFSSCEPTKEGLQEP